MIYQVMSSAADNQSQRKTLSLSSGHHLDLFNDAPEFNSKLVVQSRLLHPARLKLRLRRGLVGDVGVKKEDKSGLVGHVGLKKEDDQQCECSSQNIYFFFRVKENSLQYGKRLDTKKTHHSRSKIKYM